MNSINFVYDQCHWVFMSNLLKYIIVAIAALVLIVVGYFGYQLYTKIKNIVYPQLKSNPYFGTNIKKLKGAFEGYYRYRVGSYRLFYLIENEKILVVIMDLKHRQNAYK